MRLEELLADMRRNIVGRLKQHSIETYYQKKYHVIHEDADYEAALYLIENFNLPVHLQMMTLRHYLLDSNKVVGDGHKSRIDDATLAQKMSECIYRLDQFDYICESAAYMVQFSYQAKKFDIDGKILTILDLHFDQLFNHWLVGCGGVYVFIESMTHRGFKYADYISVVTDEIFVLATGKYRQYIIYWLIASSNVRTDLLLNKILSLMTYQDVSDFQCDQTAVDVFIEFCSNWGNQKYVNKFIKKLLTLGLDVHIKNSSDVELIQSCRSLRLRNLMLIFA